MEHRGVREVAEVSGQEWISIEDDVGPVGRVFQASGTA